MENLEVLKPHFPLETDGKKQKTPSTKYFLPPVALRGFPYHGCPELSVFWL